MYIKNTMGVYKFDKKETFALIGGLTGLASLYKYTLTFGIITIICGFIAKRQKSVYWSWAIMLGVAAIAIHFLRIYFG